MNQGRGRKGLGLGLGLVCFALGGAALSFACGARTQLYGALPCRDEGATTACEGVCGEGERTCVSGFWSECDIPDTTEECDNDCGTGQRSCRDEKWSECYVEPVVEECDNNCGTGERTCVDNEWGECEVEPVTETCSFGCGDGTRSCEEDTWGECSAPRPVAPVLKATVRDFLDTHPDMERDGFVGLDSGIVEEQLGFDDKPVFAGGTLGSVQSAQSFGQWYRDVPGVNLSTSVELPLSTQGDDFYVYRNHAFFPIDDQLFGNQSRNHNFHFTLEAHGDFVYQSGQVFAFDGDDDMWVFINRHLVIDLGGLHTSLSARVELDDIADAANMVEGGNYEIHIFFAERRTVASNFVVQTSIDGLGQCAD